jgi:hypothetical protein
VDKSPTSNSPTLRVCPAAARNAGKWIWSSALGLERNATLSRLETERDSLSLAAEPRARATSGSNRARCSRLGCWAIQQSTAVRRCSNWLASPSPYHFCMAHVGSHLSEDARAHWQTSTTPADLHQTSTTRIGYAGQTPLAPASAHVLLRPNQYRWPTSTATAASPMKTVSKPGSHHRDVATLL